ncbi:MAG TPA: urease accessory protein UreD [Solirubrobacteraceae bacterium]|nr:urease accessory protein UreD [Solirubrobacteraceae bacterium]
MAIPTSTDDAELAAPPGAQRGSVSLRVELRDGRSVVTHCAGAVPLAPRMLSNAPPGWASVALVQTAAGPLGGDRLEIEVEIGPGARLELRPLAATIAYPARVPARQRARCLVASGGRLAWLGRPVVLAAGCRFETAVDMRLESGGAAVLRETVVLGRHGESAGSYESGLSATLGGEPLLRDRVALHAGDAATRSLAVLGGRRAYGSVALLGLDAASPGQFELAGRGRLTRAVADDAAELDARLAPAEAAYLAALAAGLEPRQ